MNEEQLMALGNDRYFELFLMASTETYHEYCKLKAEAEGLSSYSEPVYELALQQFENRIDSLAQSTTEE